MEASISELDTQDVPREHSRAEMQTVRSSKVNLTRSKRYSTCTKREAAHNQSDEVAW